MEKNPEDTINFESSIDLIDLFNFLKRNKKILFFTVILSGFLGSLYSLSLKKVWQGEFQVVIEPENKNSDMTSNVSKLFSGLKNLDSDINTQIGILKSPSVLNPIFNYHNSINSESNLKYKDWVGNLDIKLEDMTRILNIQYKDTNKEIILPILQKLSKTYQQYSDINKKKDLDKKYKFIVNQVKMYKKKRNKSLSELNSFAIENDLEIPNKSMPTFLSERIRIQAVAEIRDIDKQLERLQAAKDLDNESLYYQLASISQLRDINLTKKLEALTQEIIERKLQFTGKDDKSKALVERKIALINELFEVAKGILETEKAKLKASSEAASRPKKVLIDFNQLLANSQLDEFILQDLEKLKNLTFLEKSESSKPWRLITVPSLLEDPIAPSRKLVTLSIIFFSIISISIYLKYKEQKSGIIYNNKFIVDIFNNEKLTIVDKNDNHYLEQVILKILESFKVVEDKIITIVNHEGIEKETLENIQQYISKANNKSSKIILDSDVINNKKNLIFVSQNGLSNKKNIERIYKLIQLNSLDVNFLHIT